MLPPPDILGDDEIIRFVVEISLLDGVLLERYAAFKNAIAAVEGRRLKRKQTRKCVAEWYLQQACIALREQLAGMTRQLGDLPDANDAAAVTEYAHTHLEHLRDRRA